MTSHVLRHFIMLCFCFRKSRNSSTRHTMVAFRNVIWPECQQKTSLSCKKYAVCEIVRGTFTSSHWTILNYFIELDAKFMTKFFTNFILASKGTCFQWKVRKINSIAEQTFCEPMFLKKNNTCHTILTVQWPVPGLQLFAYGQFSAFY